MVKSGDKLVKSESFNQFLAAFTVNIISISQGAAIAWTSPFLPLLQSENSPLITGAITTEEASWIGSSMCFGGLMGIFSFGYIANKLGKKIGLILLALPHMASWLHLIFGAYVHHIYLARILTGMTGGGMIIIVPLYIADISDKKIRGALGLIMTLVYTIGNLIGYMTGNFLSYETVPLVMLPVPILFIVTVMLLPETPFCLLRQNKLQEAEKSLMFYRNVRALSEKSTKFDEEFNNMVAMVESEKYQSKSNVTLKDLGTSAARKGLFIGVFLMALNQFSGYFAILTYTASIFKESGSDLSPNLSTIIVAIIQIVGTSVSFVLVDKAGRKILLIISTLGTGLGLLSLSVFSFLKESNFDVSELGWIPVTSLSFVIFIASLGLIGIPFFILPEVLPQKVSNFGNVLSMVTFTIASFIVLKILPLMLETVKLYGAMGLFAAVCFIGTIIIIAVIPETKGKDLLVVECETKEQGKF